MSDAAGSAAESDLPPYPGIALADVRLVRTAADIEEARAALLAADAIGFDTESKPTFLKGQSSDGPHLIQLATDKVAYLFQIGPAPKAAPAASDAAISTVVAASAAATAGSGAISGATASDAVPSNVPAGGASAAHAGTPAWPALAALKAVLESERTMKVGFGLSDDVRRLRAKLGIEAARVVDLSVALRGGQRNDLGAKSAVAKFFGQKLQKSKKISTTNWASARLSERQILYAADDAHVALRVYRHWIAAGNALPPQRPAKARKKPPPSVPPAPSAPSLPPAGDRTD